MKRFHLYGLIMFTMLLMASNTLEAADNLGLIVTSFYPMQILTLNVTKGIPELQPRLLLPATLGCPHDYSLTPSDVTKLTRANVLIMNGEMEQFITMEKMREINPRLHVIVSGKSIANIVEQGEVNPHSWVSPFTAAQQVHVIETELSALYPQYAQQLKANAAEYAARLEALGAEMKRAIAALPQKKIMTFHDAFAYFARDLGLDVVGVIELEPGTLPTARHIQAMIALTKQHGLKAVFAEVQYPADVAETIAQEAGIKVLVLDPMASAETVTLTMYEDVMHKNIAMLKEGLE
jgi:zinc transport system substrate-binding protein